ncbi:MAG: STAS domain-containing protein [Melioribacteraceae bacterium]|nr:STAS domain-containing protein [Melioribacteraceae bacterium]MCF8353713.1 STAS domain-containing protein [Melioribacteraceae bacterium]MCF8394966.1 STAS domain-containing protein [Melioribacteraceae bacterium]MCF8418629.1 STAS domain-containing protein [Melioribacteraceae bacterium]
MNLTVIENRKIPIIKIEGKMLGGPETKDFYSLLQQMIMEQNKNVVVDLSGVKYVNSSGIGMLVRGFTTIKEAGGEMKLASLPSKVKGVLSISKLHSVFDIKNTADEAVGSF